MKKYIIALVALTAAASVLAQGTMTFNNRLVGSIVTKVYGVETPNSTVVKTGNTSADTPGGTQTYTGAPLSGNGWYAQLWAAPGAGQPESALQPVAGSLTTFRTGAAAGFIAPPPADLAISGAAAATVATLQMRVWPSTYATWAAAENDFNAGLIAWGKSELFSSDPLAGAPPAPSTSLMTGLRSFNVYTVIPEPSTFALLGLGALGMLIFRRK